MRTLDREFKNTKIGKFPIDWDIVEFKELFDISAGGDLKKISFSEEKTSEFKYPIYSNSLLNKGLYGYSKEYQCKPECITITARGDVGRAEYRNECFSAIVRLLVLKPKKELSCHYVSNFINTKMNFEHVGAAQNQLTVPSIEPRLIAIPQSLEEQQKISALIMNYDNLIENNTRRIQLLESMAKLIYDEWFVKFKFPGHEKVKMIDSELGEIPEGWEVTTVKSLLKRLPAGEKYTQENVGEEGIVPVIDQSEKEYLGFHNNEPDHEANPEHPIMIFGDHTCKMKIMVKPFSVGPNTIPFISIKYPEAYIYFLIRNLVHTQEYKRHWNVLTVKKVIVPEKSIVEKFAQLVTPVLRAMTALQEKNLNLSNTRDLLLPKLMSGELDVSDLDIKVPEVETC